MAGFFIEPNQPMHPHVWDNALLWEESGIYVMVNHRLALWCWMQSENVFDGEHALIHIDKHTDARQWVPEDEAATLPKILSDFPSLKDLNVYEGFQFPPQGTTDRAMRPAIVYDNFVSLAIHARLFSHYYIYSSQGDWKVALTPKEYDFKRKIQDVYDFGQDIERHAGKCIVDVDLDFFDHDDDFPKKVTEDALLKNVFGTIAKHRASISMITISINEMPGDHLWEKRQHQLGIVKEILSMEMPVPIMT